MRAHMYKSKSNYGLQKLLTKPEITTILILIPCSVPEMQFYIIFSLHYAPLQLDFGSSKTNKIYYQAFKMHDDTRNNKHQNLGPLTTYLIMVTYKLGRELPISIYAHNHCKHKNYVCRHNLVTVNVCNQGQIFNYLQHDNIAQFDFH